MTVIANAGADQQVAFQTLPDDASLTGLAVGGSGTYVQWQWYVLDLPDGSTAALDNSALQNPIFQGLDLWGNFLLFLTVKDDLNEWSEEDPLLAPDSAFMAVRIEGVRTDVQKLASGERNFSRVLNEWAQALEDGASNLVNQIIEDHDTSATGAELNALTDGSTTSLHNHPASGSVATEIADGLVKLATAPTDAFNPKAVTRNLFALTALVDGTMGSSGWQPGVIDVAGSGNFSKCCLAFRMIHALAIQDFTIAMADSGSSGDTYEFELYEMTLTQYYNNDFGGATLLATMVLATGTSDKQPRAATTPVLASLAADNYLCLRVTSAPTAIKGGGLSFIADARLQY